MVPMYCATIACDFCANERRVWLQSFRPRSCKFDQSLRHLEVGRPHYSTPILGSLQRILTGGSTSVFRPYLQYRSKPSTPNPTSSHLLRYLLAISKEPLHPLLSSKSSATSLTTEFPTLTSSHPSHVVTSRSFAKLPSGSRGGRREALGRMCGSPEPGAHAGSV